MTSSKHRCMAITKSGSQCTRLAIAGSEYCYAHGGRQQNNAKDDSIIELNRLDSTATNVVAANGANAETKVSAGATGISESRQSAALAPEMELLMSELDGLNRELRAQIPDIQSDDVSPAYLVQLFNQSIGKYIPEQHSAFFIDLESNLEDATFSDFTDPDVLQGFAMLTYYSAQAQAETWREPVTEALQRIPGSSVILDIRSSLAEVTLQDLRNPASWKDAWQIASYGALLKTLELFQDDRPKS